MTHAQGVCPADVTLPTLNINESRLTWSDGALSIATEKWPALGIP